MTLMYKFTQQFDPFTATIYNSQDGYGPTLLAALEFISRLYGIHITQDKIYWSCLDNGKQIFSFTRGTRVITNLKGELIEVVGITQESKKIYIDHLIRI